MAREKVWLLTTIPQKKWKTSQHVIDKTQTRAPFLKKKKKSRNTICAAYRAFAYNINIIRRKTNIDLTTWGPALGSNSNFFLLIKSSSFQRKLKNKEDSCMCIASVGNFWGFVYRLCITLKSEAFIASGCLLCTHFHAEFWLLSMW